MPKLLRRVDFPLAMVGLSLLFMSNCWIFAQPNGIVDVIDKLVGYILWGNALDIHFINHTRWLTVMFSIGYWACSLALLFFLSLIICNIVRDARHKEEEIPLAKAMSEQAKVMSEQTEAMNRQAEAILNLVGEIGNLIEKLSKGNTKGEEMKGKAKRHRRHNK
jgi:hypothetical protein